ncbi:hypothetical protein ATJ97_3698 [Georgenia soli]|uniref:Concanavalin A-like lectin/glucanase superfamily protein n=1 Tax=Georgenia soli TaxID=638953 RepID=A0A2A9ESA8_9MICO|nr:hypothetical protein [Georgenia soli]PFG41150.1 hypothetical protein ATJ97_3698 [Georgenia soli]
MRAATARACAGAAGLALALGAIPAAAQAGEATAPSDGFARCDIGDTRITDVMAAENWAPLTPEKWEFPGDEVILAEAGVNPGGYRRPFEYAILTEGRELGNVQIEAEVRLDTPATISNRDVIIVFGYQSDTEFYYAHLSQDNTIYAHNGIFRVDNADRFRIEHQWDGTTGAPPAVTDEDWHDVKVTHCADTGEIAVYVDGADTPLMTAVDTTFSSGRVGFGSFDNVGRIRDLVVTGTATGPCVTDPSSTVVLGDVDSGVANVPADDLGCTIDDLILDEQQWDDHGEFVEHVTAVTTELRVAGVITGQERGALTAAAARSSVGKA